MTDQLEILITLILYTLFFAWIGYQRGSLREGIVAVTALGGWILLQEAGDILIRIVNLGSKFVAFVRAGGLGANPDEAFPALSSAAPWVTPEQRDEFLFIVWVFMLVFAYVISNLKPFVQKSKADAWAVLLGIFNGLLYATILLPKLATLVQPTGADPTAVTGIDSIFAVLGSGVGLVSDSVGTLWGVFDVGQRSIVLLVLLTIFLLLAASTLSNGVKNKKPSSAEKRS